MRSKAPIIIVGIVVVAGLVLLLANLAKDEQDLDEGVSEGISEQFKPRRSASELSERLRLLREERGGLPAELAARAAQTEEQREFWQRRAELQKKTPEQALSEAREKLEQTDADLSSAEDEEEVERLQRQKRLVEEIIQKLERMTESGTTEP